MRETHELGRRTALAAAAVGLVLVVSSGLAAAAEAPTRSEYVAEQEQICKPDVEATQRAMKGVRDDIRAERDGVAAKKFGRGAEIFAGTVRAMQPVARPSADRERLRQWFVYLHRQEDYLEEITRHLQARRTIKAQRATARFIHNGNLANDVVLAFGFDYCSFRFSRFG